MSKELKRDSYIHISSFMVSELNLKGNELLVYAIIYGFCQDEESDFHGSLEYIQAWTNSSKQGVLNSIKSLLDKGFITKVKKGNFCYYKTNDSGVKKVDSESQESLPSGVKKVDSKGQKSLPNNIYILNNDNKFNINSSAPSSDSLSTPFPEPEDYPIDTPKSNVAEVKDEKKHFKKTDYSECISLINKCKNTLKSKGISVDETQWPYSVINKYLKHWFEEYGVEKTKQGIINASTSSFITKNQFRLTVLFSDKVFPQLVSSINTAAKSTTQIDYREQNYTEVF